MAIHVALTHETRYTYDRVVRLSPQVIRLRPAPHCRTRILAYSLHLDPKTHFINWQQDPQGNYLARVVFPDPVDHFHIRVEVIAEMAVYNPFDFFLESFAEEAPFDYPESQLAELAPYRKTQPAGPQMQRWLKSIDVSRRRTNDFLVELNQKLYRRIDYVIREEPGVYTPEQTLEKGKGSCRDTGWLLVQTLRHLGLAARFVSGYLIQLAPDVKALDGPSGPEEDFTDLHAWAEVYLPGAGWIGLDPTSGLLAGEGHIPLACTPEPPSAAPLSGAVEDCETTFGFEMSLQRVHESPRVTRPYRPEQWEAIHRLGEQVDAQLEHSDVRLTMGGEPTFVAIDAPDAPEWNTSAVGGKKRTLSEQLLRKLYDRFAPGGFLHYGQGKWYPGEPLPRWAYSAVWRKDGQPLWQNPELLAKLEADHGFAADDAERFSRSLAEKLGCGDAHLMPAYEDVFYYLWKERRLPDNVDPLDSKLDDPQERRRMARLFEQGLDTVVGYALPLQRAAEHERLSWISGPWFLRPETLLLIPGDSPMGLRLPLDSLPWVRESDYPFLHEHDPQLELPPLPDHEALARQYALRTGGDAGDTHRSAYARMPEGEVPWWGPDGIPQHLRPRPRHLAAPDTAARPDQSANWIVRTALCVEPREGNLFLFLPPTGTTEDYVDLLSAVEATADELGMPVVLEGYLPPHDARLESLKITPDPGVIEVNIHPSHNWSQLKERTEFLYEAARECRLGTEKFMLDGRHTGTGGGNHIVVGGATPAQSPFLRRPHLLKSLLTYWQHHPSLSYLFSGLFLGPTSQAPRIDEARHDSLYELEIAFNALERALKDDGQAAPWLVDRLFRNLLIDVTGNTHRAEFCIDKLYSPDTAAGRLGLLELRSFEMPPHAQMSLTQQLLMRACIAHFWDNPYAQDKLVRWGTDLHDKYLLPHYTLRDFNDVIDDLRAWGMPFDIDWFAPHDTFRFPHYGTVQYRDIELELRGALEPWNVLGEEGSAGGTVRYVDSSVERLQVKVRGLTQERYAVTCNGQLLPLKPTGTHGEAVAGVRYRAWQPAACLHPTVPVNAPLVFDVIDRWNARSLGGCTYAVSHPGGRSYDTHPVNSYEAESRRLSRFWPHGHTPGSPVDLGEVRQSPEAPATLDLREPNRVAAFF